jgi:hypothetical protein
LEVLFSLFVLLFFLLLFLALVAVVGHWLWLFVAWFFRQFKSAEPEATRSEPNESCKNCGFKLSPDTSVCPRCGYHRPTRIKLELLKDLAATERQLKRFQRADLVDEATYNQLIAQIESERDKLTGNERPQSKPAEPPPLLATPPSVTEANEEITQSASEPVVTGSFIATEDEIVIEPVPSFRRSEAYATDEQAYVPEPPPPAPREPRRSFAEMLNAFMEESNIRWGEIVGGLLIIGCSTALVVSLWSQISQIPVLKFLIFTTVTAALFGVGLYTEHRWKLPTTSRGILTTATLLVPLNFLAIAAVSSGMETGGAAIIASELIAPAVFLCLVYFAGKVLTPAWPHLLVAGVLGSSVGQLLIRHFATPDISPSLLVALGAFPLVCYVAAAVWMLRKVLFDPDARESTAIFITVGALSFAAVLPFALLLYKTGPVSLTMMYLAPLVSFGGFPSLAVGLFLWRQSKDVSTVTTRTVGTALSILGMIIVVAGMVLAWPNPASIVPAALFNFAVFTALAIVLELPHAHVLAAVCLALAYLVLVQVLTGHIAWLNIRETSLLSATLSVRSGLALAPLFLGFVVASEWFAKKRSDSEGLAYLVSATIVACASLLLTTAYGAWFWSGPLQLWFAYITSAIGAFWIGWRRQWAGFTWSGSVLLLAALAQSFALRQVEFPWQTAIFSHATICAVAVLFLRRRTTVSALLDPLRDAALIASSLAVIALVQASSWQTTSLQAQRVFWLAGIWLLLVWITRKTILFIFFQVALTLAVVLSIKATLQEYAWYAYLPHAFLHPRGLQIQGTVLVLLSLAWLALRKVADSNKFSRFVSDDARRLLSLPAALDRIVLWLVLAGFVLLSVYGALPGITRELTAAVTGTASWDIGNFPHQEALQIGSWILLALLLIAFLGTFWQLRKSTYLFGAIVALACVCPLLAGTWETNTATASAWRWCAAILLLILSLPLWFRSRLQPLANSVGWPQVAGSELSVRVLELLLVLTVVPLIILTLYPAVRAVYYLPMHWPSTGLFAQLDLRLSYAIPLIIVALVVIGHGLGDRLAEYVLAAGLFFNAAATMAFLFSVVAVNGSMNRVVVAQAIQINAIVFALYALVWLAALRLLAITDKATVKQLLAIQVLFAVVMNLLLVVPTSLLLSTRPEFISIGAVAVGSIPGWISLLLTVGAGIAFAKVFEVRFSHAALLLVLLSLSCLVACLFASPFEGNWTPAHVYLIAITASAWLLALVRYLPRQLDETAIGIEFRSDWSQKVLALAGLTGVFAGFLSLRLLGDDPSSRWWSIIPLLFLALLFGLLNWFTYRRRFIYLGGIAFTAAALIWAFVYFSRPKEFFELLSIHVIALTLSSIFWLYLELRARRLAEQRRWLFLSFHNFAAVWALILLGLFFSARTLLHPSLSQLPVAGLIDWLAIVSLAALLVACLWDKDAKYSLAALYITGLVLIAQLLDQLALSWESLWWAGTLTVAAYEVLTSFSWRRRQSLIQFASSFGIPKRIDEDKTHLAWLVAFNLLMAVAVTFVGAWVVLEFPEFGRRLTAALAVTALCFAFGFLAEGALRRNWQRSAIAIFVIGLVFCGWSMLTPSLTGTWFNRAVITMVELFALIGLYGVLLEKVADKDWDWPRALRDAMPWVAGAASLALLFSLATEVFYQVEFGTVNIAPLAVFAIGATLVAGIFISLLFALSPKHDPLGLSERGRMGYVYGAEVMLALLFMHIRLSLPWLFTGFFERYWPLVVMVIAYLGVATSETLRRRKLLVLAQPLERTGVFLPLLPVLGFWLAQSEVDYSALLFLVGGLYALVSLLRRSFIFGLLAAIAGNGGLWYLWHRSADFQFLQHPQLWLIPVAVSVLVAVYLNEEDFSPDQMASIRYLCLVTIYASSTADIFVNGVANSPWLPLILAALSLAGVFGGIILRIRGFLLLGSVFLLLSIITMIWYASANLGWTWLWYVAGIVTGAMIIFMFAVFEKKRNELLRLVEGLKEWER